MLCHKQNEAFPFKEQAMTHLEKGEKQRDSR